MQETNVARTLIIAEAGVNHNGAVDRALALVDAAAEAGADIVKFQHFVAANIVAGGALTAAYQEANTGVKSQADLLAGLQLDIGAFARIAAHCRARGIGFLCTPFDMDAAADLAALGMGYMKIPSGEATNIPMLKAYARFGLPVLLSTGMCTLDEVGNAVAALVAAGAPAITLLQCTSTYPAPPETLNLRAMANMAAAFGLPVGFSDHSLGIHAPIAAVALGAVVIEKHVTLDRALPGPDHKASLEPAELAAMVRSIREVEVMLGDGKKIPTSVELATARLVRRAWHAKRALPAGHTIAAGDVTLKRPGVGLQPAIDPLGRRLRAAVAADEALPADAVEELPVQ